MNPPLKELRPLDTNEMAHSLHIHLVVVHADLTRVLTDELSEMKGVSADLVDIDAVEHGEFHPGVGDIVIVSEVLIERWCSWRALHPASWGWTVVIGAITCRWLGNEFPEGAGFLEVVDLKRPCLEIVQRLSTLDQRERRDPPGDECTYVDGRTSIGGLCIDDLDRRIIAFLVMGMMDREIAGKIHLSPQTVRNRVSRMLERAYVSNRTQLAILCVLDPSLMCVQGMREESTPRRASIVR